MRRGDDEKATAAERRNGCSGWSKPPEDGTLHVAVA
jgi:hypothetical protein